MPQRPHIRDAILAVLKEHPEGMTYDELVDATGMVKRAIQAAVVYERAKNGSANIYIKRRTKGSSANRHQSLNVYALGPGEDAGFRKVTTAQRRLEIGRRYREKNRAIIRARDRKRRGKLEINPFDQLLNAR